MLHEHIREDDSKKDMLARFRMAERVWEFTKVYEPTLTCLEDYDLGTSNQHVSYQIAEVAAILKWHFIVNHVPLSLVNPRKLKSYIKRTKIVTKKDVVAWAETKGFILPPKKPGGPGYYQREREDLSDAFTLSDMALRLSLHLEEGHLPRKGDIFLDQDYGLAFRRDLLFNTTYFQEPGLHANG